MENFTETKKIINEAKNIYLVASQEPEAITSALALFYTLKELDKNVNLIMDALPENLKFLAPSLNFISYPKNLVISIPNSVAQISQIYYEKNNDALKVHLTLESGNIKKDNVSFYFSETKPDLIITVGVKDYVKEISGRLDSFGFLLDSPILNIDNVKDNKNFGKINLIEEKSLAEIVLELMNAPNKNSAACLLTGIIIHTENFKNKITANILQTASDLMKAGADLKIITDNIKSYG
jgi:nanoRNase/pAp phosphatase (c-di-AMP/oligoRNAs hydrolase)